MADGMQERVGRVRPPRVHISYEVHTGGTPPKREIPFVVGVMADLSGQRREPLSPVDQRKFTGLDPDTFETLFTEAAPHLTLSVDNVIAEELREAGLVEDAGGDSIAGKTTMTGDLDFHSMADFEPRNVAQKVPGLRDLVHLRDTLEQVMAALQTNPDLDQVLEQVLNDSETQRRWKEMLGLGDETRKG